MALVPATIEIVDREAIDPIRGLLPLIPVQFNPTEYTLNKSAQIAEISIPGLDSPIQQFIRGQSEKLTMELFFDTTKEGGTGVAAIDVRLRTGPIYQLVKVQPKIHAPPRVRFHWGPPLNQIGLGGLSFKGIVESVQQKFDLFNPLGIPLRATLNVTFREYKTLEEQLKELNLQSPDHTKRHLVQRGDTLISIAKKEYDDPSQWREIARLNNITNPRRLTPGAVLEIPPLNPFGASLVNRS